ncbi:MTH1187 family thiamine-binding protein [Candidatus Bipolaricaulota bacterium]
MIAEFSIVPIGSGESLSQAVAAAFRIIEASGLRYEHHAMGTNLEGDWDAVMAVIRACRDKLLESSNRVSVSIKIDDRRGATDRMTRKLASAKAKM